MVREISHLTTNIGVYGDANAELEKPDSDTAERKEIESKVNAVIMESNRLKQELSVMKHQNKLVRRQNTDAAIATNEAAATAKKIQKIAVEQNSKLVVARSTYSAMKVAISSYESKHHDATQTLNQLWRSSAMDTDTVRLEAEIDPLNDLVLKEQKKVHQKIEEIEALEAKAEELRFDCRAIKYEIAQQQAENRRTKRNIFDLQSGIDMKMRLREVMDEELAGYESSEEELPRRRDIDDY